MAYVLMIRETHHSWSGRGPITVIHPSEEAAQAGLANYVRENWNAVMHEDPPEDDDELVEQYFEYALEEYDIGEAA